MFPLQLLENNLRQVHLKTHPKLLGLSILYRNQLYLEGVLSFILQQNSDKISTLGLFPAQHVKNGFPLHATWIFRKCCIIPSQGNKKCWRNKCANIFACFMRLHDFGGKVGRIDIFFFQMVYISAKKFMPKKVIFIFCRNRLDHHAVMHFSLNFSWQQLNN